MYDDLVDRLRSMPDVFYEYDAEKSSFILQAADRIEQLTGELDKAVKLGKAGGYKATPEHSWAEWCNELYCDLKKADGRIEQLEAALEKIGSVASQYSIRSGLAYKMINIAHTALEGNNGGQDRLAD